MARSQPESRRTYTIGGRAVDIALQRSSRRSVGLKINADGLTITLPVRYPIGELDGVLRRKADWILSKLDEVAARPAHIPLGEGGSVDWLGEPHTVRMGYLRGAITADELHLATADPAAIPLALQKLMRREARGFLAERLALWAGRLGLAYAEFKLTSAGTRWGSCTSGKVIRLHWRLMQAPLPVIDYVAIHELCHLVELNHSPRFWTLVASVCPDWKAKRDWLKREGGRYFGW